MIRRLLERLGLRRPPDVLRIAYEPKADGKAEPGEVVWTWVPYEDDPKQGKDRPVLVIGWIGAKVAAVALTSKDHGNRRDCVPIGTGAWDHQGRPSFAKIDRMLTVKPTAVRREGASLPRERFDAVIGEFRAYHHA